MLYTKFGVIVQSDLHYSGVEDFKMTAAEVGCGREGEWDRLCS